MRTLSIALTTLLLLALTACSGASGPEPEVLAQRFFEAIQSEDPARLEGVVTVEAYEGMTGSGGTMSGGDIQSMDIGETRIDGDRAEVDVSVHEKGADQEAVVLMRRVDSGEWRVHGMRVAFGGGEFTMDFEAMDDMLGDVGEELAQGIGEAISEGMQEAFAEAQSAWDNGGTPEEVAAARSSFEALRALDEETHDEVWQVTLDTEGRTARELLNELLEPCGMTVDGGEVAGTLEHSVPVELKDISRVEAVERIARALELHPIWPDQHFMDEAPTRTLGLARGPRPHPCTFAGPFLIEVTDVVENTPSPTGELHLAVRALGLDPACLALGEEAGEVLRLQTLRGPGNEVLTDEDVHYLGTPELVGSYFAYSIRPDLSGLLRGVDRIATLDGEVRAMLPTEVETLTLEQGDTESHELESGTLVARQWGEGPRYDLSGEDLENVRILSSPLRADGSALGTRYAFSHGWKKELQAGVDCAEEPARIEVKICRIQELSYSFELPPVAFAEFAQRPAALETLTFQGAEPIAVAQVGSMRQENGMSYITLRLHNRSNKDVGSTMVEFQYLDAGGQALEDFPHTLMGTYDFDLEDTAPLVRAGATTELETHAAFVPDNTASIRFRILSTDFPDGTNWASEDH